LEPFAPNPLLAKHFSELSAENRSKKGLTPDAGGHNLSHFRMMSRFITRAHESVCKNGTGECTAVVFGAKECTDVPLEILAGKGFVYLVDVDAESLRVAKEKMDDPSLRDRVDIALMDASLFENTMIDEAQRLLQQHPKDMDRAFRSIVAMNRRAAEGDAGLLANRRLPIEKSSIGFVVSSMTLSQFMIGYIQVLVKMFLDHYGRERTREYLLSGSRTGGQPDERRRVDELQHSTSALARKVTEQHVRELGRIVKPDGAVILSDHSLHGRCAWINENEVEVDTASLIPYSKNPEEDKTLRFREDRTRPMPTTLRTNRTQPELALAVEGADALKRILEQDGRMEIADEQGWWWATERAKGLEQETPVWHVCYVEAFALTPRRVSKNTP
jgi:hypothetical protein